MHTLVLLLAAGGAPAAAPAWGGVGAGQPAPARDGCFHLLGRRALGHRRQPGCGCASPGAWPASGNGVPALGVVADPPSPAGPGVLPPLTPEPMPVPLPMPRQAAYRPTAPGEVPTPAATGLQPGPPPRKGPRPMPQAEPAPTDPF
jgi:hypothetical protein